ncbi:hypothetical protein ACFX1Z_023422 [Malus domestica]
MKHQSGVEFNSRNPRFAKIERGDKTLDQAPDLQLDEGRNDSGSLGLRWRGFNHGSGRRDLGDLGSRRKEGNSIGEIQREILGEELAMREKARRERERENWTLVRKTKRRKQVWGEKKRKWFGAKKLPVLPR